MMAEEIQAGRFYFKSTLQMMDIITDTPVKSRPNQIELSICRVWSATLDVRGCVEVDTVLVGDLA